MSDETEKQPAFLGSTRLRCTIQEAEDRSYILSWGTPEQPLCRAFSSIHDLTQWLESNDQRAAARSNVEEVPHDRRFLSWGSKS